MLLYLVSTNPAEAAKQRIASRILDSGDLALSVQVLQEFYVQSTRTRSSGRGELTYAQAALFVEAFLRFPAQEMTVGILRAAMATRERYVLSLWDSLILEAARTLGCGIVLSEDLSHGAKYGSVKVVNPFV